MASHIHHYLLLSFNIILHLFSSTLCDQNFNNYIIHMNLSAMPKPFLSQQSWYLATLSSLLDITSNNDQLSYIFSPKLTYTYTNVMNGFSASLSPLKLEALKTTPGYISSIRDLPIKPDTTHSPHFIGLNPVFGTWPTTQYGKNIIIGLIDSGIWPESESFKDDEMPNIPSRWKGKCENGTQFDSSLCNKKLIGARFFNKGLLANNPNITITMNSTRDIDGHGTHTSTTAAGSKVEDASFFGYAAGSAIGMAPHAHVSMYKVLWKEGAYASDTIAAIDSAISDGVDVLSLSLGFDEAPLYEDPVAIATFAAMEKNIFVSTSAGNRGPVLETLHNGTPWVITVAAGTMDREFHGDLTLGNGAKVTGLSLYPGNFSSGKVPMVFLSSCDNLKELIRARNKIVVCEDKNRTLATQVDNLDRIKVVAGVFISNSSEDITYYIQTKFPSIFLNPINGELIKDFIKCNTNPKASMQFNKTVLGTKPAPSVDSYSSRGPSHSCPFVLKPDITAPGTLILASWPQNVPATELQFQNNLFNNFNLLSGTSMSCPHVAGVAALLKEMHPCWSPAAIRSAMMTTSDMLDNTKELITDIGNGYRPASPLALGAGHINPNRALDPGLVYDAGKQDYVNLLCALNFTQKNIAAITRSSFNNCSNPSLDLNYPSFISFFNNASVKSKVITQEFQRTVTNVGEEPTIYVANITPIEGFHVSVIPNKLVFKEKNEKVAYKLRIEGPKMEENKVVFGYLTWTDSKHNVRSPIVVTSLNSELTPP
ncbi:subtilisin-like serine protease [Medicago truncatula]|uniref:Subtilisin-like serine protease n=1 Tax=Medicago truncatula TaxID=3880 RepID=G7L534_MEDTR|nr:subtilisin-like serine protease [Medicago truncatula]